MIFCLKGSTCQSVEEKKLGVKNLLLFGRLFGAAPGQIKKSRQKTTLQKKMKKVRKNIMNNLL